MWPTGETPPALAAAIHQQGGMTPEEIRATQNGAASAVNGQENYRPPPRPAVDMASLEAEKASLQLVPQNPPGQFPSVQYPSIPPRMPASGQRYHLPLSREVSVEIVLHGSPTPADLKLLQRYVRLMSSADFAVVAEPVRSPPVAPLLVNPKRPRRHAQSA
jgi:hypothetical protein